MTSTQTSMGAEECIQLLERGELTEAHLRAACGSGQKMQSLMYANSYDTNIFTGLGALSIIERGVRREIDAHNWPYRSVAEAMQDGWRIIKFPDFVPDESRNYGLGCEYVLEKWD